MRPVVFSASSVNSYLECHLQWWFTYILAEEGAQTEPQRVGIDIHDYAEKRLSWTRFQTERSASAEALMQEADREGLPADIIPLAEVFDRDILPTYRNPVMVEQSFQLEVEGIPYSGIIDAVDEQDTPWGYEPILRDLKSTGSRPRAGRYRFNMIGYWLGARDLGREPSGMQLDYIVRTKTPYYWPEVQRIPDNDDLAVFATTLMRVADLIARADYRPTGLGTRACSSCPHAAICGPYQRFTEVTDA
jgi:hypothetical protein